jgi:hypothetical protein
MSRFGTQTVLASGLLLFACNASIEGTGAGPIGTGGSNMGTAGTSSAAGSSGTGTTRDSVVARCETTQLAPPQLRRLTKGELERSLRDVFPALQTGWSGVKVGADQVSSLGFSNDARMLVVAAQTAQELLDTAQDVATTLTNASNLPGLVACAAEAAPGRACADQLVQSVGPRLFRRALSTEESTDYGALFDSVAAKSDFATGVRWMLVSMIQSPSTVYRSELGGAGGGPRQLTGDELATELAYTFGGTTPTPELMAAAARGDFATPEARVAKAKELLATPAGREQLHQFLGEWSGYPRVASRTTTVVPAFDSLRSSMIQETKLFLEEAVINRGGGVRELLTGSYTFVDSGLASLYGFGGGGGATLAKVERPAGRGVGLLAQGSILAGAAHSDASSPTLRGLVVYERLLCHQRTKPPPNVPSIEASASSAKTTRQRYEESHVKVGCTACHQHFDPIGFAFEHYDQAGRYRADENGFAIDASGQVVNADGSIPFSFDGLEDLSQKLAERAEVADCVSGLAAAYAFAGAGGRACLAEDARAAFGRGEVGVLDYFAQLAAAPSFVQRAP